MSCLVAIERYIVDVVEGKRKCYILLFVLELIGNIYGLIVFLRNELYDKKICNVYRSKGYVVSVGNIVSGGTGKTPFLCMLASFLQNKARVAILTRGYRSPMERGKAPVQISSEKNILYPASQCGDEPFLLASHTGCSVFVGKDRVESAHMASSLGYSVLLLDDGMQHRRLFRDKEIVVIDAKDPWGQRKYLPGGFLRDSPSRLRSADLIVLGHHEGISQLEPLIKQIRYYTSAPIVFVGRRFFLDLPKGAKVGMFCGIAKPAYFEEALRLQGVDIVDSMMFADHTVPDPRCLAEFAVRCKSLQAVALVCTEKDFVKLENLHSIALPVIFMKMEMYIEQGIDVWEKFISKMIAEGKFAQRSEERQ